MCLPLPASGIDAGIKDYVKIVNDAGGIKGRPPGRHGLKVDASVAAEDHQARTRSTVLRRPTGSRQDHQPRARNGFRHPDGGASFATELQHPEIPPAVRRAPTTPRCSASRCATSPKEKRAKVAFVYSDSSSAATHRRKRSGEAKNSGSTSPSKIMTAPPVASTCPPRS